VILRGKKSASGITHLARASLPMGFGLQKKIKQVEDRPGLACLFIFNLSLKTFIFVLLCGKKH
jgi:hypothetical protein